MPTTTSNLGLTLPTPNVDTGWGSTLNTDFTLIDDLFNAAGTGTSVGLQVGTGKTLGIGGTLLLGTGDGTGTLAAPTIRGPNAVGSNVAGTNLTINASNGTGTGGSGKIILRTAPAGSTGSSANTLRSALEVNAAGGIGVNSANYGTAKQVLLSGGASATADWGDIDGTVINFTGQTRGDLIYRGASAWQRLPAGTSGQFLKTNGSTADPSWANVITEVAVQSIVAGGNEFTGIPSTAIMITLVVANWTPADDALVQIGTSSGFVTTGYISSGSRTVSTSASTDTSTTGFFVNTTAVAVSGTIRLTKLTANLWTCDHVLGSGTTSTFVGGGYLNLPGALDRVRIIPETGTFAATGLVSLKYM